MCLMCRQLVPAFALLALVALTGCDDGIAPPPGPARAPGGPAIVPPVDVITTLRLEEVDRAWSARQSILAFRERQCREAAVIAAAGIEQARETAVERLNRRIAMIKAQVRTDEDAVEYDVLRELQHAPAACYASIASARTQRLAEIERHASEGIAAAQHDIAQADAAAQQQHAKLTADLALQLQGLAQERATAQSDMRQRRLDIGRESAKGPDQPGMASVGSAP